MGPSAVFLKTLLITICFIFQQTTCQNQHDKLKASNTLSAQNVSHFVINGDKADASQYPYFVYINAYSPTEVDICGGTLIAKNLVLTAAHCLYDATQADLYFAYHLPNQLGPITIPSTNFAIHKNYGKPPTYKNDIALITIPENIDIKIENYIRLDETESSHTGEIATIIGYGVSDINNPAESSSLLYYQAPIVDNEDCKTIFKFVEDSNICIAENDKMQTSCMGDSGGPVIIDGVQIGIVSYGSSRCDMTAVNTRVAKYVDWIRENSSDVVQPHILLFFTILVFVYLI